MARGRRSDGGLGTAETLAPADAEIDTVREGMEFPSLDGADDRRMEDLVAARLFPRQAAALRIGRYTLLDRIGQGGMGVVYAAYDPELDRRVAIKLLSSSLAGRAEERLLREAQAMARVAHANVVAVIEVGRHQGQAFVVMEHLRGVSLDRWAERRPGWREILRVYVQAGRGLAAAHRAGVIHRDFKPHNAMLIEGGVDDGRVKVLDFGLARAALDATAALVGAAPTGALALPLTRTGALMGTPAYMSPEQLDGQPAGEPSDQFSFAASLYEALYGQLPFAGDTFPALTQAIAAGTVRPPPAGADVPAWVHRVVLRGLARRPEDRHASMTAMCDALERDPAARRRALGLSLSLAAVVGAGGWGLAQLGAPAAVSPCSGPAFELDDVWNDTRGAELDAAFAATGLRYADDTALRVRPLLGAYASEWTDLRKSTCEAHQRGEQSAQLLDLRMACLDRRRASFSTLVDLLAHADAPVVERAVEAALQLPALATCADAPVLTSDTPVPDDPNLARDVEATRVRLAEIGALASAGRLAEASTAAEETLTHAESLGFQPLIAESALALGTIALEQQRGDAASRALTMAVHSGIEGRTDHVVAEAWIRRHFVDGAMLGQAAATMGDEPLLVAHAARFPHDGWLQWLAFNNRGAVAYTTHDFTRARSLYEQALSIESGPTPLEFARTHINLGLLAFDTRDFESTLASHRAGIAQASETLGPEHPLVLDLLTYEASALHALGRNREARERLASFLAHQTGEGTMRTIWPLINLSRLDRHSRRFAEARTHATRALASAGPSDALTRINAQTALADATTDPDAALALYREMLSLCATTYTAEHAITAAFQRRAASGLLRLHKPSEALPLLRSSLATCEKLDPADATTAESHQLLADALLALGERDEALTQAEAAVRTLLALPGDRALDLAQARRSLGRALLARGDASAALEALESALAAVEPRLDADDPDLAATRVELARALLAAERPAAAGPHLEKARDAYAGLGEPFARERDEAARLLQTAAK